MQGCGSQSALVVNAEVDSMGGVIDGGLGVGVKTSPRRTAIEKAHADLRQEYDVREEKRREIEFLEKGGDPLDFKSTNGTSLSVQSTSFTDQQAEHFLTSEAKDSFALTASPHGDSVESSGRPAVPTVGEPNSADNLLLFNGENELLEGEKRAIHPNKKNKASQIGQASHFDGNRNSKESEESAIFRPYARRYRSRSTKRDLARSSSTDVVQSRGAHTPVLPSRGGSKDVKGSVSQTTNQKDPLISSSSNLKIAISNGNVVSKTLASDNQLNNKLDGALAIGETNAAKKDNLSKGCPDVTVSKSQHNKLPDVRTQQTSINMASCEPDLTTERKLAVSAGLEPCEAAPSVVDGNSSGLLKTIEDLKEDGKRLPYNGVSLAIHKDPDECTFIKVDANGISIADIPKLEAAPTCDEIVNATNEIKVSDSNSVINDNKISLGNNPISTSIVREEDEVYRNASDSQNDVNCSSNTEVVLRDGCTLPETNLKSVDMLGGDPSIKKENSSQPKPQDVVNVNIQKIPETTLSEITSVTASDPQFGSNSGLNKVDKAHEDSVLEEARSIEAKRKRIAELSVVTFSSETRRKSQWDFVLEEMAWLANDFTQERIWKKTTAAQISHRVAFTSRIRYEEQKRLQKVKRVASILSNAVMQLWHSAEEILKNQGTNSGSKFSEHDLIDDSEASSDKGPTEEVKKPDSGENSMLRIHQYAMRFLEYNSSPIPSSQVEAPATPDNTSNSGVMDMSWEDHLTEESLFYAVSSGAMGAYRKSIESHLMQKTGCSAQEEVETSIYNEIAGGGYVENAYDEDEVETITYYRPGDFEGSKPSKFNQKRRKNLMKSNTPRSYELVADMHYGNYAEGSQQSMLIGKRPATNLNIGSIPTKRVRTASRQRVVSPFGAGSLPMPAKTDPSSGETDSFQDDHSMFGGSMVQKSMEVDSSGDFEKRLPYDSAETSAKPKKKKKAKHMGSAYDPVWQLESTIHSEQQRDNLKKRSESHHFDSNSTSGLYGQHNGKKQKITKHMLDNSFENTGSMPSPAASQMSNMSNPSKFIKLIGGRDKGRKTKTPKISASQPGSGSPWSLFEDQALVVLVHDMGPNWELISDAISSTLKLKCIYRKPIECKERHKVLMDRGAGDGADSAEDSGTSQSYPSTLPGIPKGSARQLFQRLQGPMEEDTLKSHFEKIFAIEKKQHYKRIQNDIQDPKHIVPVHNSHIMALSQVCPNNLHGNVLTPFDLCDATSPSPDLLSLGYQGSHHSTGLATSNQGTATPALSTSVANSSIQGSSGMVVGSNVSSPSGPLSAAARLNVPRTSVPLEEQQRVQQYNQMVSGRNTQQSSIPIPGSVSGSDRGLRMVPGGNGMGMMCGVSRGMPVSRPGIQAMGSSTMLNSSSMLSPGMVAMPSIHSGASSGQGNSMLRPREGMHMIRVPQGSSQAAPVYNGFPNQAASSSAQPYPGHSQQPHQITPQPPHMLNSSHHPHLQVPNHAVAPQHQAAYARQRQMHQRYLQQQQQQQQFAGSGASMPHMQPSSQHPVSPSAQNSSQIQTQASSNAVSHPPATTSSPATPGQLPPQQKPQLASQGLSRNPQSGSTNPMGKQRQRQQFLQSGRQHPSQRQPMQSQQQAKILKVVGRGNVLTQNLSVDTPHLNGASLPSGTVEKGDKTMHLMQGQGLYSGSSMNTGQPSKTLIPQSANRSQPQHKVAAASVPTQMKQLQQIPGHLDNSGQCQVPPVPSGQTPSSTPQSVLPTTVSSNHQHLQPHQKQTSQSQLPVQRLQLHNHQRKSEQLNKSTSDQTRGDSQTGKIATTQTGTNSTIAVPQTSIDSANTVPPPASCQRKTSEQIYDSGQHNTASKVLSIRTASPMNPASNDTAVPLGSQGLGNRLTSHGHDAEAQLQQQSPPPSQKHCQLPAQQLVRKDQQQPLQEQLPSQQLPDQQKQHLPDAKVE